jgi:hypothetical protein
MIEGISPFLIVYAAASNSEIKKNLKCEKIPEWEEEEIMKREFEEERTRIQPSGNSSGKSTGYYNPGRKFELKRKVQPIYDSSGKLVYDDSERHLDFIV